MKNKTEEKRKKTRTMGCAVMREIEMCLCVFIC